MEFTGFNWDLGNRAKCQKHGLTRDDIESVFDRSVVILPDKPNSQKEKRYRAIGTTRHGRRAFIIFTLRQSIEGTLLRPISARYMHQEEVELYEKNYTDVPNR